MGDRHIRGRCSARASGFVPAGTQRRHAREHHAGAVPPPRISSGPGRRAGRPLPQVAPQQQVTVIEHVTKATQGGRGLRGQLVGTAAGPAESKACQFVAPSGGRGPQRRLRGRAVRSSANATLSETAARSRQPRPRTHGAPARTTASWPVYTSARIGVRDRTRAPAAPRAAAAESTARA